MTVHQDLSFHNVAELRPSSAHPDVLQPQRVPEDVRLQLNASAQDRMLESNGMEIRFVCDDPDQPVELTLSAPDVDKPVRAWPYWGSIQSKDRFTLSVEPRTITLLPSERYRATPPGKLLQPGYFHADVRRLLFEGGPILLHAAQTQGARPPRPEELPHRTLLTYGTSITQGVGATGPHLTYANLAARSLGVDLINLGSSGSCHCDPVMAEYLPTLPYDFACLCLSVNMVRDFDPDVFEKRAEQIVSRVMSARPGIPVVCLSILPWYYEWEENNGKSDAFRDALEAICRRLPDNVQLIDGRSALADLSGLSDDMIHPSDHGMIEIAHQVAQALKT